ncbi:C39 family peptidase [Rhodococcus qingshengii]|uniref:C39 family peptidase n=1 Tax=Rhodococcus qingshengii TaxID=334542 RepID=UPI0035D79DEE
MAQKLLPYDRGIVRQETGYWCGPASAQVVLNSRGINVAESTLAREMGTTTNGTDYIGLIERVLDQRVPNARYTSVQMPNDPPTLGQKDRLWRDILRSVNAGWGVIVNIVAPRSNYPRGVNGSISPSYSGGTVYHYMSVMGYDDATRAVWIADSGFSPFGYWMSFDQLATLIPPKGYAYADIEPAPVPDPKPEVPVRNAIDDVAAVSPWLGKRLHDGEREAANGGRYADFEHGSIYWHPEFGAHVVPALVYEVWKRNQWEQGFLGYPREGHRVHDGAGDVQEFQGGTIARRYGTAGFTCHGVIGARWAKEGGIGGPLGWPTSDEYGTGDGGRRQDFDRGSLVWHPSGAIQIVGGK